MKAPLVAQPGSRPAWAALLVVVQTGSRDAHNYLCMGSTGVEAD
jgi:hypothetical protein